MSRFTWVGGATRKLSKGLLAAGLVAAAAGLWIVLGDSGGETRGAGASEAVGGGVPDLNGIWGHHGFGYRVPFINETGGVIDGYDNEYLRPWTAEAVMRDNFTERAGRLIPTPHTTCYPDSVPTVFALREMQILQTPEEVILIFQDIQQVRHIYLNQPHSAHVEPSWYGESVGHWEGDTLVVDTIGVAVNPQARVDRYGTPHSEALHIVERFRLLDRPAEENVVIGRPNAGLPGASVLDTIIETGRPLELIFTLDDPIAFRKPWSVTLNYSPLSQGLAEDICAENNRDWYPLIPKADIPDF